MSAAEKRKRMTVSRFYSEMVPSHWPEEQKELAIKEIRARLHKRRMEDMWKDVRKKRNARAARNTHVIPYYFPRLALPLPLPLPLRVSADTDDRTEDERINMNDGCM